jgi:hypothetical protein
MRAVFSRVGLLVVPAVAGLVARQQRQAAGGRVLAVAGQNGADR